MKPITPDELKKVELDILLAVADFCEKKNLRYFLGYGTLLGAVRHKGFIPWDDDIDIFMPRKDYDILIEKFNSQMDNTPYRAIIPYSKHSKHTILKIGDNRTLKSEPEYRYTNSTKSGMVDIDVFPLDGTPEDIAQYDIWYKKLYDLYDAYFIKLRTFKNLNLRSKVKLLMKKVYFAFFLTSAKIIKETRKLHQQYPYEECDYIGSVECCWNSKGNHFKKEWFVDYTLLEFDNYTLKAPVGYHEILKSLYGDYMRLPPEKDRIPLHKMNIFWKE